MYTAAPSAHPAYLRQATAPWAQPAFTTAPSAHPAYLRQGDSSMGPTSIHDSSMGPSSIYGRRQLHRPNQHSRQLHPISNFLDSAFALAQLLHHDLHVAELIIIWNGIELCLEPVILYRRFYFTCRNRPSIYSASYYNTILQTTPHGFLCR